MTQSNNSRIRIRSSNNSASQGKLTFANKTVSCMLGRQGIRAQKLEGDGATPMGSYKILYGFYRADRLKLARTAINFFPIRKNYGWCDDPTSRSYNQFITIPNCSAHEKLWRDDHLYDICLVLDHNHYPRVRNRGSAIFFHLWHPKRKPTEGCVAISLTNMQHIIGRIEPPCEFIIEQ